MAAAWPLCAHDALGTTLEKFEEEIREHPGDYLERSERAWLMLEHNMTGQPVGEDIDTLLTKPVWRENAMRLRAYHLYLLGSHQEAEIQARKNIATGVGAIGPEQYRLLAGIALARKDTAGAIRDYRDGWERMHLEEDYISMVRLSRRGGDVPDALLEEGLRAYPTSPGVHAVIFRAYLENQAPDAIRNALAISGRGQAQLWPRSVDWKIRHARALLAADRAGEAERVLLRAMGLLEGDTRLKPDADMAIQMRHEIFGLLDIVKTRKE